MFFGKSTLRLIKLNPKGLPSFQFVYSLALSTDQTYIVIRNPVDRLTSRYGQSWFTRVTATQRRI